MDVIFYRIIEGKKPKDKDPKIIAWQRESRKGVDASLIYSFPQPGDNIKEKKFFAVKDYEKALFYNKGQLIGVLSGGVYELEKKARIKGTEIVYIDTSLVEIPWGIPQSNGIPTKDGYVIGLHGDLKLRIEDVKSFYTNIVAGNKNWMVGNLRDWIISLLHTSLRDIFKVYNAKSIILEERERVINLITSKVTDEFLRYSLELETFNIINIKAPDDTKDLFETDKTMTKIKEKQSKEKLESLLKQKDDIEARIKDLKEKLNEQQDLLLDDKLSQEDYEKKKAQIQGFLDESEDELRSINEKISTI